MVEFTDVRVLKEELLRSDPQHFYITHVLSKHTQEFDVDRLEFVAERFNEIYNIDFESQDFVVVGSAKIGYALHPKRRGDRIVADAFREYSEASDIDIAICSPKFFSILWTEVSQYAANRSRFPHLMRPASDYLLHGWLRIDHLPVGASPRLLRCDLVDRVKSAIRQDRKRGHPKVSFGIFADRDHLRNYQVRGIRECRQLLERPL